MEGGLNALTSQLTKVKSVKTKKLNALKKTIERFNVDQNNLELWEAMRQDKKVSDDTGEAFTILMDTCIFKMQEEIDAWTDKEKPCHLVSKHSNAQDALLAYTEDKDDLDEKYFELAGSFQARQLARMKLQSEASKDSRKLKSADSIKPGLASLKLSPTEFQVWMAKAEGWIVQSNFMIADVKVQKLYVNAVLDKEIQLKVEALPEYNLSDALQVLKLVEQIHDSSNPLFVKRTNFYAANRTSGETGSAYISRVRVLADLAKLKDMDHTEHVKFRVLRDLPVKIREKVIKDQSMTLDAMTVLVAEQEAMDIVNNSFKSDHQKQPVNKAQKPKEESMAALETKPKPPKQKKKTEGGARRGLPDEAYRMGCWICGEEHRRDLCQADRSSMVCNICGRTENHVTKVCLQQFAGATASGQPGGRPPTPQSGMVVMEERRTKKRSYAQVAGGGRPSSSPGTLHSPLSPSSCTAPGSAAQSAVPSANSGGCRQSAGPAAGPAPHRSRALQNAAALTADGASPSRPKLLLEVASPTA